MLSSLLQNCSCLANSINFFRLYIEDINSLTYLWNQKIHMEKVSLVKRKLYMNTNAQIHVGVHRKMYYIIWTCFEKYLINHFLKLSVYVIHIIYVVKTFKTLMKFSMPETNEKTLNNEIFVCYKSTENFFPLSKMWAHIMCMLNVFFYVYYNAEHMYT